MKTYHITLQGQDYTICLRSYSVEINGTRYKIRSLPARKLLFLTMEVDLPISGAHVMLVSGLWSMELVVDGVMLRTGKPYTPIGKIPVWAYVVSALNLAQIMKDVYKRQAGDLVGGVHAGDAPPDFHKTHLLLFMPPVYRTGQEKESPIFPRAAFH